MSERLCKYVHSEASYGFQPNQTYAVDLMEEVGGITVKEDEGYVTGLLCWLEGDPKARCLQASYFDILQESVDETR